MALSIPGTLVGPKWDAVKNKWKWVLSANYAGVPSPPFVYGMYVNASVGENASEPKYGEVPCPPAPYTIWIEPIQPDGTVPYAGSFAATVENSLGDIYRTDEYDLVAPCMLVELAYSFHYEAGLWSIAVTATIYEGTGPFSYHWSPVGATAGGKTTDHSATYALDRAEPIHIAVQVAGGGGCVASASIALTASDIEAHLPPGWDEGQLCDEEI